MIDIRHKGSIFDCGADCLVNPVNCVGVMGKGLAAEFKAKFPKMFREYKRDCSLGLYHIGVVRYWYNVDPDSPVKVVVNFPTKYHWFHYSKLEWIEMGLEYFSRHLEFEKFSRIAMPALGCGNGGLKFEDVLPAIEKNLILPQGKSLILFAPQ